MSLSSGTVAAFSRIIGRMTDSPNVFIDNKDEYDKVLEIIRSEVGDNMTLKDARTLCRMGFFITHRNLESNESMHAYGGKYYYEDGACLSTAGILNQPPEWMEEGWRIKACPHEVDYDKLRKMHKESHGLMIPGQTYEDCIIRN